MGCTICPPRFATRCSGARKSARLVFGYLVPALEPFCPAVGVAFATSSHLLPDYRPLATPWVLAFPPFILLSVLRLRPTLCWFSGIVSSIGNFGAAYYVGWHGIARVIGFTVMQTAVLYFALILLVTGVLAAGIATEIRTYVEARLAGDYLASGKHC